MKSKWIVINAVLALIVSAKFATAANAPIQRIDVVNMLGDLGGSATSVVVSFSNGVSTPCFTKTLPYLGAITVWAGTGQVCVTPVTSIMVTPVAGATGAIYDTNPVPTNLTGTQYSTQITISQNTAPIFDPNNGSLLIAGTVQATAVTNWTKK
jgi:hypothetical protein